MRGTTSLLRYLLGQPFGTDYPREFIEVGMQSVHVFECFSLVNFLMCSALEADLTEAIPSRGRGSKPGRSTRTMQLNCASHYRRTLEILEPTVVIAQGKGVRRWMRGSIDSVQSLSHHLPVERIRLGRIECLLATFSHPAAPSRENWGMNDRQPYLLEVVAPTLRLLRKLLLSL